jgi:hypothetical protein
MRLLITLACLLLTAGFATADYYNGYQEDGYTYAGGGYWVKGADYYTRREVNYTGYRTAYNYGYAYRYPQVYYYYEYLAASKPVSSLTPQSSDSEWIDFLKQRERIQGKIATNEQEKKAFVERLKAIGVTPPFPGLPGYELGGLPQIPGYSAVSGSTLYGYGHNAYSYSQVADIYGTLDPNILMQGSVAMARESNASATAATSLMNGALNNISAAAERLQAQRLEGEIAIQKIRAVTPNRVTTTINGKTAEPTVMPKIPPLPNVPAVGGGDGPFSPRYVAAATNACITCHAGKDSKGGFDMTSKLLTAEQKAKVIDRVTRPTTDPKHMPQTADGKPGRMLTAKEIVDLLD